MKFRAFVGRTESIQKGNTWKYARVVAIVRGSEVVRHHVLKIIKKELEPESTAVYTSNDFKDSMWKLLSYSTVDMRIVFWSKTSMSVEAVCEFLEELGRLDNKTVILDASEQIFEAFQYHRKEHNAPWAKGKIIDCSFAKMEKTKGREGTRKRLFEYWLNDTEKLNVSPRLLEHFSESPFLETFNTIAALKFVGEKDYNLITAERWGVLWVDHEREVMRKLLYKGRGAMRDTDWRDINNGRFFWLLFKEMVLLLKFKTMFRGNKREIPQETYQRLKEVAGKVDLRQLYRRMFLVINLMRWREHQGAISLLIFHW